TCPAVTDQMPEVGEHQSVDAVLNDSSSHFRIGAERGVETKVKEVVRGIDPRIQACRCDAEPFCHSPHRHSLQTSSIKELHCRAGNTLNVDSPRSSHWLNSAPVTHMLIVTELC